MAKFGRKGTWKKVLAGALAVVLGVGAIAGISALVSNKADDDGKITVNPKWSIGGLDAQGKYEESDATLYTKDAFECKGLTIKPDFDSNVKYQVFFYDEIGSFIESSSIMESSFNGAVPSDATHARLEVTPIWNADVKSDDRVIKWYNKNKWQGQLEIKVSEKQTSSFEELPYVIYTTGLSDPITYTYSEIVGHLGSPSSSGYKNYACTQLFTKDELSNGYIEIADGWNVRIDFYDEVKETKYNELVSGQKIRFNSDFWQDQTVVCFTIVKSGIESMSITEVQENIKIFVPVVED